MITNRAASHHGFGLSIRALLPAALCVLAGAALSFAQSNSSPPEAKTGFTGRILFEHCPEGSAPWPTIDIYSVNADGTDLRALTTDGHSHSPRWSPDGRHILYIHDNFWPDNLPKPNIRLEKPYDSHFAIELYVMDRDGGNAHLLRQVDGPIRTAAWSPDGITVAAYYSLFNTGPSTDNRPNLRRLLIPMQGQVKAGPTAADSGDFAWKPGRISSPVSVQARGQDGYLADVDGSLQVQLEYPPSFDYGGDPSRSPDGRQMAVDGFIRVLFPRGFDEQQIFLMHADGSDARLLTTDPNWLCANPAWSPDGTEIAFFGRAASAPCLAGSGGGGVPAPGASGPGCVRRIFVLSLTDPKAKPVNITQVDGANPVFAPVP